LPRTHPILKSAVEHQLELAEEVKNQDPNLDSKEKKKLGALSMTFYDFETSEYKVSINPKSSSVLTVSLRLPCYSEIKDTGVTDMLEKSYGDLVVDTEKGFSVSLAFDVMDPPKPKKELVELVINLKENILTAPLLLYFNEMKSGSLTDPFNFNLRPDTKMYIVPASGRVTVALRIALDNKVDLQVAEIFLKDYKEVQRRKAGGAPPALFSINAPEEVKGESRYSPEEKHVGFLTFAVQQQQMRNPKNTAAALVNFRSFLQYHLKCSKAFFHSRMRKKVREFLKVLNRAKTDFEGETKKKAKKTASGRVFKKKAF